jgi:two-component system sensor histidine kinase DegS
MKQNLIQLSQQYTATLERHLKRGPRSLLPALNLGRGAVALGLETLDLARIHEQAIATLGLSNDKNAFTRLAGIFFTEANTAIEQTHQAARQTKIDLSKLVATLGRRTQELATSNRQLQKSVVRRKVMEDDFAKRRRHHQKCLQESLGLQKRLRHMTHQVLAAQEDERKKISHELQDEIAQTLLGINVRLLSLKQRPQGKANGLKNEIASTQRLVVKSARSVRRFAHELDVHPQTSGSLRKLRKLIIRSTGHPDENKK